MDDFLALEPLLIDRLKQAAPDFRGRVFSLANPEGVDKINQMGGVAWVIYHDARFEADRGGRAVDVTQIWGVVVSVRAARDTRAGRAARAAAGPLIAQALRALAGWHPGSPLGLLRPVTPPWAAGYKGGFLHYPLAFETRFAYSATTPLPGVNA